MPGNISIGDRFFHSLALFGGRLLEVLVQHPRRDGPDVPFLSSIRAQHMRQLHRAWEVIVEICRYYVSLGVSETNIQVTLGNDVDLFHRFRRYLSAQSPRASTSNAF